MKIRLLIAIVIVVMLFPLSIVRGEPQDWVIEGDTVYIDDQYIYMSATPHTLGSSGWVEFELLSKIYEGPIDVIWGFNESDGMIPSQPQIWKNDQWQPLNLPIQTLNIEYGGCDTWRLIRLGNGIFKDKLYKARCWVQIPFAGLETVEGKYTFAVKPSTETMTEAVLNNHLYILDPWWSSSWAYKKQLTFDNSASTEDLDYFPVLVHLDDTNIDWTKVQNVGEDIRFVDSDDSTELDYEIELWDDTNDAWIWVEVPQIDAGSTSDYIYMYYGNASATDNQDVPGTWDENGAQNFLAVYHMADDPDTSHIVDSTANGNDGDKKGAGEPLQVNGNIGYAQEFDGFDDYIEIPYSASMAIDYVTMESYADYDVSPGHMIHKNQGVQFFGDYSLWRDNDTRVIDSIRIGVDGQDFIASNIDLHYYAAYYDGDYLCGFLDGASSGCTDVVNGVLTKTVSSLWLGVRDRAGSGKALYFDGYIDEIRISKTVRSAEWIEATDLNIDDTYITYEAEEEVPAEPPTNFTLTNINDNQVDITWTMGVGATHTEIRRKINEYPEDRTDGTQVYYGTDDSYSDTGDEIGLELDKTTYYYRAWSMNVLSVWSTDYAQDYIGGENMGALALALSNLSNVGLTWLALIAVIGVSALAFWKPMAPLFMILAAMAMMLGLQWYDVHSTELGMGISIGLIAYSVVCLGLTYRVIFQRREIENEE